MALRVWLPLNGNLENNGLSDLTITNNGATINNNGKIGKTYSFDGSDDYISLDSANMRSIFKGGTNPFTIAFWIYNTKTSGARAVPFGDYGLTGTVQFNLELNSSAGNWNNDIRFYWAGNPDYRASGTAATPNTWVHLAIIYDGTKTEFYRNGSLVNTRNGTLATLNKTTGVFYLGRDSRTGDTAFKGYINDFRVYDEALSPKQIKEISKGLVAHYKLDSPYLETTTNLIPGTTTYSITTNPAWDTALNGTEMYTPTGWASGYNAGVAEATSGYHAKWEFDEYGKLILKLPNLNSIIDKKGRWLGTSAWNLATTSILAGQKYTISWWQKTDNLSLTPRGGLYFKKTSDGTNNFYDGCVAFGYNTKLNTWEYMTHTFTRVSDYVENTQAQSIYIYGNNMFFLI